MTKAKCYMPNDFWKLDTIVTGKINFLTQIFGCRPLHGVTVGAEHTHADLLQTVPRHWLGFEISDSHRVVQMWPNTSARKDDYTAAKTRLLSPLLYILLGEMKTSQEQTEKWKQVTSVQCERRGPHMKCCG